MRSEPATVTPIQVAELGETNIFGLKAPGQNAGLDTRSDRGIVRRELDTLVRVRLNSREVDDLKQGGHIR
jgi:hypothetical protein